MKTRIAMFLCAAVLLAPVAQAQRREHERERFNTPHWVFDDRFHHNHYYPAPGYSIAALPAGNLAIGFGGRRFWVHSGVWFEQAGPGYVVVRPPPGVLVPVLPPSYTAVWVAGVPYYYANDVYYGAAPGGYVVASPPMSAEAPPAPQAAAPQAPAPQSNSWFYCESTKAYYPYVAECKEGWKQVPATPPR